MKLLKNQLIVFLCVATLVMTILHMGVIYFFFDVVQEVVFQYLFWDYLCFFFFSVFFLITLVKVKNKYPDNFGYLILILMTLKTALSYGLFEYFLMETPDEVAIYKLNFLFLFVFYLGMDVYGALKLLNDSEQKS